MGKRSVFLGLAIGILVLLNLWKWLPSLKGRNGLSRGSAMTGLQLNFPLPAEGEEKAVRRDLFSLALPQKHVLVRIPRVVVHLEPSPQPTPLGLAPDGSILEASGGYRLMGMASREGKTQALIGKSDQVYQVKPGDDIDGRY